MSGRPSLYRAGGSQAQLLLSAWLQQSGSTSRLPLIRPKLIQDLVCQADAAKQVLKTNVGTEIIDSRVGF